MATKDPIKRLRKTLGPGKHKTVKHYKGFEIISYGYTWRVGPPINKRFYYIENAKKAIDAWERKQYKKDRRKSD